MVQKEGQKIVSDRRYQEVSNEEQKLWMCCSFDTEVFYNKSAMGSMFRFPYVKSPPPFIIILGVF